MSIQPLTGKRATVMRQLLPGDIIWRNIRLATMDPQRQTPYGLVDNHALIVREGGIVDIVPQAQLPVSGDNIHDMQGRLVTPGLIDCHTHLIFAGNRADEWEQRLNGVSYQHISAQGAASMPRCPQPAPVRRKRSTCWRVNG